MASTPIYNRNTEAEDVLLNGNRLVNIAGTAVQLATVATPCYEVTIQAKSTNSGNIYVGGEGVPNNQLGGVFLSAGQSITLTPHDLRQIWINADLANEGVTFIYWTAL